MVGRAEDSNLCGFEGAKDTLCRSLKLQAEAFQEVGRPFDGRSDGERVRGSERQEPRSFPVTIA